MSELNSTELLKSIVNRLCAIDAALLDFIGRENHLKRRPGEAAVTQRESWPAPHELTRQEAALYLGVGVKTFRHYHKAGLLRYRNTAPPGSGKPRYLYPLEDLARFRQEGYRRDVPRPTKPPSPRRK